MTAVTRHRAARRWVAAQTDNNSAPWAQSKAKIDLSADVLRRLGVISVFADLEIVRASGQYSFGAGVELYLTASLSRFCRPFVS